MGVIDTNVSNTWSVVKAINRLGHGNYIVRKPSDLVSATHIILPGVGAFDSGISQLQSSGLYEAIKEVVSYKQVPILGICLGMHLLCLSSQEGSLKGLSLINANVLKLNTLNHDSPEFKIPNIGWCQIESDPIDPLFAGISRSFFYFCHSYAVQTRDNNLRLSRVPSVGNCIASFGSALISGVQFHPEKSHTEGLLVINNFLKASA